MEMMAVRKGATAEDKMLMKDITDSAGRPPLESDRLSAENVGKLADARTQRGSGPACRRGG